jgi:Na+/phosphate symporter
LSKKAAKPTLPKMDEGDSETIKLGVRLLDAIQTPLRDLVRFQGDLAKFIVEAIETVDVEHVPLVVMSEPKARDTTIRVSKEIFDRLADTAKKRNTSMNAILNTAVAHWLQKQARTKVVKFHQ